MNECEIREGLTHRVRLGFKKLNPNAQLPKYAHEGDAGMDVFALHDVELPFNKPVIVKTGIAAEIPDGYELQVRPRSGFAAKGITVWNAPGTIDSKYRGEIGVILFSTVPAYRVNSGDKIAQLVLAPVTFAEPYEVQELSETERGADGFGSTGR